MRQNTSSLWTVFQSALRTLCVSHLLMVSPYVALMSCCSRFLMFLRSHWFFSLRSNTSSISSSITRSGMLSSTWTHKHTWMTILPKTPQGNKRNKHQAPRLHTDLRYHQAGRRLDSVLGQCRTWGGVEAPGKVEGLKSYRMKTPETSEENSSVLWSTWIITTGKWVCEKQKKPLL